MMMSTCQVIVRLRMYELDLCHCTENLKPELSVILYCLGLTWESLDHSVGIPEGKALYITFDCSVHDTIITGY